MKVKRLAVAVFTALFVAFTLISFFAYDKSTSVSVICEKGSYAEKYAKKHRMDYKLISDSDKNFGLLNLDDFQYNYDGTLVSYSGKSKEIVIPDSIDGKNIFRVKENAFEDAKNLKEIYLSKNLLFFEPNNLKRVTVYIPEDSQVYQLLQWKDSNKIDLSVGKNTGDVVVSSFDDFVISADGTFESYTGDDSIISIPAEIDGLKIRSIAEDAFISAKRLTKVYLPESLEEFDPIRVGSVKFYISNKSEAYEYAKINGCKVNFVHNTDYSGMAASLDEDFVYSENGQILEYKGINKTVVVPESINGTEIVSVAKTAFDKAKGLKSIYLPETMIAFFPETLNGVKVFAPENAPLHNIKAEKNFEYVTFADSYYVNFYSGDIPYSYDELSGDAVKVNQFNVEAKDIVIPETIDNKKVTAISVDALGMGAESILIPGTVKEIETDLFTSRYDATFYIGLFIALAGFVIAVVSVSRVKLDEGKEKTFLRISVLRKAYSISICSVIFAVLYVFILPMFIKTPVPVWVGGALAVLIIVFGIVSMLKINTATEIIEKVGEEVKEKTFFVKALTVDADTLVSKAKSDEAKAVAKKVYEAVRYSDPMSDNKLAGVELQIEAMFDDFSKAVNEDDVQLAKKTGADLLEKIEERNKKCKMLK